MKKFSPLVFTVALVVLATSHNSFAATPINQTRALNADGEVSVENISGLIKVRVWNEAKVQITGSLGEGAEKLVVEGDAHSLHIKVKYPERKGWFGWGGGVNVKEATQLELMVPIRAALALEAVSANIDVQGSAAPRISIDSVSGNSTILASSPGKLSVESVSGNVSLKLTSSNVTVNTVSGDIKMLGHLNGRLEVETVSGNVELDTPVLNQLHFNSVSGDGRFNTSLAGDGRVEMDSVSGSLSLILPKTSSAQFQIESFSGDISSAIGKVVKEEFGPGQSLNARLGVGDGHVNLNTMSGDIRLETR
ncbi:MAG: DUF4097 family beta strand repeat-containing protein [Arenimonas sp.]